MATTTRPSRSSDGTGAFLNGRRPRVLLGVTGSVAGLKGPEIAVRLSRDLQVDVGVVLTRGGDNFWAKAKDYDAVSWSEWEKLISENTNTHCFQSISGREESYVRDKVVFLRYPDDEWKEWNLIGDPVLHIDLRNWADILLIAPLSAHSLSKLATGLCDDTLSCCVRAWDFGHGSRLGKPLVLAPAMNTAMWHHPLTGTQLDTVRSFWNETRLPSRIHVVAPQVKGLACGEVGDGALAEVSEILMAVQECINSLMGDTV